jgi:hypothetical protein
MGKSGGGFDADGIDFSKFGAGPGGPGGDIPEDMSDEEDIPDEELALEEEEEQEELLHAEGGASKKIEEVE